MDPSIRHCERSEAIRSVTPSALDCFVASLLAMTTFRVEVGHLC
jgi:hypothetical protein